MYTNNGLNQAEMPLLGHFYSVLTCGLLLQSAGMWDVKDRYREKYFTVVFKSSFDDYFIGYLNPDSVLLQFDFYFEPLSFVMHNFLVILWLMFHKRRTADIFHVLLMIRC